MLSHQMFGSTQRSQFDPFRDLIFNLAMEDPASFELVIALAAAHDDGLRQKEPHQSEIGQLAALRKMKAIRLVSDRLSKSEERDDDRNIFAVGALW